MPTYAIGDVQGCYDELRGLLDQCGFDADRDSLWFVGDLVNRGPKSLNVLRFVRALGDRAVSVLGNHDLHLLAVAEGVRSVNKHATLKQVIDAPDAAELLDWLRHRPLLHQDGQFVLVHAGLLPTWSVKQASALVGEVEKVLRNDDYQLFINEMYGDLPDRWNDSLTGIHRLRFIVNAMTRMRAVTPDGRLDLQFTDEPTEMPKPLIHWADAPKRRSRSNTIICGHWAAQGLLVRDDIIALDTGCVWGGPMTAVRLEDRKIYQFHD